MNFNQQYNFSTIYEQFTVEPLDLLKHFIFYFGGKTLHGLQVFSDGYSCSYNEKEEQFYITVAEFNLDSIGTDNDNLIIFLGNKYQAINFLKDLLSK